MNFGIVGCGLVGSKRAAARGQHAVLAVADAVRERAERLARAIAPEAMALDDWCAVTESRAIDAVIVATPHDQLAPIALAAIRAGKHVLVEKPAARTAGELDPVLAAAREAGVCVRVGFNHRFHPAIARAKELADSGAIGPLLFVRGRYGHGGRPGYDKEWRANPAVSGGGELLDQGMHLIDLSRWLLGDFAHVEGIARTYFWDMPVDDNAFLLLRTATERVAFLHVSWTEWKNLFSLEVYGRDGKLHAEGLGGSYGTERLALYRMLPEMGPPETTIWEYPMADRSWELEIDAFAQACASGESPCGTLEDALAALRVVDAIYRRSKP